MRSWSECLKAHRLSGAAAEVDAALGGALRGLVETQGIHRPQLRNRCRCWCPSGKARQVLVVGLGRREQFDAGAAFRCVGGRRPEPGRPSRAQAWPSSSTTTGPAEWTESGVCRRDRRLPGTGPVSRGKESPSVRQRWPGPAATTQAIASGRILGESVNLTRRLVNEPPDEIYPETFAARAAEVAQRERPGSRNLGREAAGSRTLRLAVGRGQGLEPAGAAGDPALSAAASKTRPTLAIVGKGVTFDSGGLSLKTPDGMLTMKCDKAGAATMVGAMQAIAAAEAAGQRDRHRRAGREHDRPGGHEAGRRAHGPQRPHDRSAQHRRRRPAGAGRRAGAWPSIWEPAKIVDLATLTGACVVALGTEVAGVMTNDQPWCDAVLAAARRAGEPVWQLPMYPEIYDELIKSEVADIKNVGDGRWGGAITAAKFLEQFVGNDALGAPRHRRPGVSRQAQALVRRRRQRPVRPHAGRTGPRVAAVDVRSSTACTHTALTSRTRQRLAQMTPRCPGFLNRPTKSAGTASRS